MFQTNIHVNELRAIQIWTKEIPVWIPVHTDGGTHVDVFSIRNSFCLYKFSVHTMVDLHELAKYTDVKMLAVGSEPPVQWVG